MATGLAIFAISYGIPAGIAFTHRNEPSDKANELFLPVVGPLISIGKIERDVRACCDSGVEGLVMRGATLPVYAVLAIDAVAQGAGLVVFAIGVAGRLPTPPRAASAAVTLGPYTTGSTVGLAGSF